jgi:hypothetical protein
MSKQTRIKLTQSKLDLYGVQVTVRITIGDWTHFIAISPIDYAVFESWHKIYAPQIVDSLLRSIDEAVGATNDSVK